MKHNNMLRAVPAVLAIAAASFALNVGAQSANPSGPGNTNSNKAGEAYPNNPNAASMNKAELPIVQRAENSRPVRATKRAAKRTKNAVKRTGNRVASSVRNAGNRIANKLPPEPAQTTGVKP